MKSITQNLNINQNVERILEEIQDIQGKTQGESITDPSLNVEKSILDLDEIGLQDNSFKLASYSLESHVIEINSYNRNLYILIGFLISLFSSFTLVYFFDILKRIK